MSGMTIDYISKEKSYRDRWIYKVSPRREQETISYWWCCKGPTFWPYRCCTDNYNTKFQLILQKLEGNKKSTDSLYHHPMTEIRKTSRRMDAIERQQNQVVNALDFVSKGADELQGRVKLLERSVEILQQSNALFQNGSNGRIWEQNWESGEWEEQVISVDSQYPCHHQTRTCQR